MTFPIKAIRGLDHVDLRVRDISKEWTGWERLGFRITAPSFNNLEGIASCAVALSDGVYVTMSGPVAVADAHRSAVVAGVNAALLRVNNRDEAVEELRRAGLPVKDTFGFSRLVDINGQQATITFRLASIDCSGAANDIDEIMIIEQVTPQNIWRQDLMQHPNGVRGLRMVKLTCRAPLALHNLYSRLLGTDNVTALSDGSLKVHHGNAIVIYTPYGEKNDIPPGCRPGILHFSNADKAGEADLPGGAGALVLEPVGSTPPDTPEVVPLGPPEHPGT